jgi:hypothetical protein
MMHGIINKDEEKIYEYSAREMGPQSASSMMLNLNRVKFNSGKKLHVVVRSTAEGNIW